MWDGIVSKSTAISHSPIPTVATAADGARRQVAASLPELLILDLMLPKVSGFELLAGWRADFRVSRQFARHAACRPPNDYGPMTTDWHACALSAYICSGVEHDSFIALDTSNMACPPDEPFGRRRFSICHGAGSSQPVPSSFYDWRAAAELDGRTGPSQHDGSE